MPPGRLRTHCCGRTPPGGDAGASAYPHTCVGPVRVRSSTSMTHPSYGSCTPLSSARFRRRRSQLDPPAILVETRDSLLLPPAVHDAWQGSIVEHRVHAALALTIAMTVAAADGRLVLLVLDPRRDVRRQSQRRAMACRLDIADQHRALGVITPLVTTARPRRDPRGRKWPIRSEAGSAVVYFCR
jgi:hypothetical protein